MIDDYVSLVRRGYGVDKKWHIDKIWKGAGW